MAQHIVRIENYYGKTVQATVLEEVNDGILKGWNYLQMPDGSKCYMARRWCLPMTTVNDTDWRKFLRDHWDDERNHCKVEYLNDFMVIFNRAAANYMRRKPTTHVEYTAAPQQPVKQKTVTPAKPKKPHYVQLSLFD